LTGGRGLEKGASLGRPLGGPDGYCPCRRKVHDLKKLPAPEAFQERRDENSGSRRRVCPEGKRRNSSIDPQKERRRKTFKENPRGNAGGGEKEKIKGGGNRTIAIKGGVGEKKGHSAPSTTCDTDPERGLLTVKKGGVNKALTSKEGCKARRV